MRLPGKLSLAALAGTCLATLFAAAASAQPDPPPVITPPAPGVTPGVVMSGTTMVNTLYTAADGTVWILQGGPPAVPYGGRLIGAPAPLLTGSALTAFGRGTDSQLWYNQTTTEFSQPWYPLGGRLTSKAGVASLGGGACAVFVRGTDGAVWERAFNGSKWGSWQRIGGRVLAGTGPTAAYLTGSGHLYVGVVGTNHQMYLKVVNGSGGFFSIGGQTTADPALTAISSTVLAAFGRGTDNAGYYTRYTEAGGPAGWRPMGGRLTSGVSADTNSAAGKVTTYTVGLGTNSQVYRDTGTWTSYPPTFSGWAGNS